MSSSTELRILLDSTYILPILGVEVEGIDEVLVVLRRLRRKKRARFYYTEFNILEILGKIAKVRYNRDIVATGLSLIQEEFELVHPTVEGYIKALNLKRRGFKDLIDLLLYTTSLTRNLLFLTRDVVLIDFLKDVDEEIGNILYEEDFIRKYSQ
ncbi:MAG: PIN domain nuclease [Thermoprotei archaeon]|nr:PIN domain nuclease [Thermoprotei archaeon]